MVRFGKIIRTGILLMAVAVIDISSIVCAEPPGADDLLQPGAAVFDRDGLQVGTVERVSDDVAIINTGLTKVTLTRLSFYKRSPGLMIAMSRSQLEAAAARVQVAGDAKILALLIPGAAIYGQDGAIAAHLCSVADGIATLAVGRDRVRLAITAIGQGMHGPTIAQTANAFKERIRMQQAERREDIGAPDCRQSVAEAGTASAPESAPSARR